LFLLPGSLNDLSMPVDRNTFISLILSSCTQKNELCHVSVAIRIAAAEISLLPLSGCACLVSEMIISSDAAFLWRVRLVSSVSPLLFLTGRSV